MQKSKKRWKKVTSPNRWSPADVGSELIGTFVQLSQKIGSYGKYSVVTMMTDGGVRSISGTMIVDLVSIAGPQQGDEMRVVYRGTKVLSEERTMRLFDLFVR